MSDSLFGKLKDTKPVAAVTEDKSSEAAFVPLAKLNEVEAVPEKNEIAKPASTKKSGRGRPKTNKEDKLPPGIPVKVYLDPSVVEKGLLMYANKKGKITTLPKFLTEIANEAFAKLAKEQNK